MKKLFFVLFCLALVGCASTKNISSDGDFITTYDDITGVTETIHKDLKPGSFYNLRDSLSGEREHVMLTITDGQLMLGVLYQFKSWAFFKSAVFIADDKRLEVPLDNRSSKVVSSDILREGYFVPINENTAVLLADILQSDSVYIAFIGDYTTGKMAVKPKVLDALRATLNKVY